MSTPTVLSGRLAQLDGLRGIAALVVLICHTVAMVPGVGDIFLNRETRLDPLGFALAFTPLHILWNGDAAVYVFFVLSGFVLVLPFLRSDRRPRWHPYYPQRIARLYLPVWGSVLLSLALISAAPRVASPGLSSWVNQYAVEAGAKGFLRDAVLLRGATTNNPSLWSLQWEVVFSLLLPLYVLFATRGRRLWLAKIFILVVLTGLGSSLGVAPLWYLPVFAIGAVLAVEHTAITAALRNVRPGLRVVGLTAGLLLMNAEWVSRAQVPAAPGLVAMGATLIVLVFLSVPVAVRIGSSSVSQWLGRISFSLYLIHAPVLFAVVAAVPTAPLWISLPLGFVLSLMLAEVFRRLIEEPSHRLAKRLGKAAAAVGAGRSTGQAVD